MIGYARKQTDRVPGRWGRRVRDLGKAILDYRGARRTYLRHVLFGLLGRGSSVLLAPFGQAQLFVPADDEEIGRVVFVTGGYERLYMAQAVQELRRLGWEVKGRSFVDVGANIGTSTIDALVDFDFGRSLCFEPDERSFRLLMANVAFNGLEGRVRAFPVALSDTEGCRVLQTSSTNRGDNRLVTDIPAVHAGHEGFVGVQCRRFDDFVEEGVIVLDDIGVIWIDAQGHEPFVLRGATTAIEAGIPLVMEYSPAALRLDGTLEELEAMIREHYTTIIDLHMLAAGLRSQAVLTAADIGRLRGLGERDHTDLLLVRSPTSVN